ncbi:MAG: zf-HC2 domain-containing protein [Pseudomonadota bacterium]
MSELRYKQWAQRRRDDCPSLAALEAYRTQSLPAEEATSIEAHLRTCARCVNQLIDLREFASQEGDVPARLLARVRATTTAHIEGQSQAQRAQSPYQPTWWDRIKLWWQSPALLAGMASVMIIAAAVISFSPATPLIEPGLLPRGQSVDQKRLSELLSAVSRTGIVVVEDNQIQRLQADPSSPSGLGLVMLPDASLRGFPLGRPRQADEGTTILIATAGQHVTTATVDRVGQADWTAEGGTTHTSMVMAISLPDTQIPTGSAVLSLELNLLGIVVSIDSDYILAASPE